MILTQAELDYRLSVAEGDYIIYGSNFSAQREYIEWKKSQRQGMKEKGAFPLVTIVYNSQSFLREVSACRFPSGYFVRMPEADS